MSSEIAKKKGGGGGLGHDTWGEGKKLLPYKPEGNVRSCETSGNNWKN